MDKIFILLLSCIYTTTSLANCKPVLHLTQNQPAPCEGYLFSPEKELELRLKNEELKILQEQTKVYIELLTAAQNELYTAEQILTKERTKTVLWQNQAENSTEKLIKLEESRAYRDWLFLVSGVVLTAVSAWSLGQVK